MHDLLPTLHGQLDDVINSLHFFIPEMYLSALFVIVLVTDLLFGRNSGWLCRVVSVAGLVYVLLMGLGQAKFIAGGQMVQLFGSMLLLNHTTLILKLLIDIIAIIILLFYEWDDSLSSHTKKLSDLYSISIAAILGLHLMTMAASLLSIYLSVEMVSLASYLMVSYKTENRWGSEAGLKYVLFGAACSAIMLYGISVLYGLCGTLNLFEPAFISGMMHANPLTTTFALVLLLAGIGFKLSFVPMHFWVPDIYQGAPTPVSAFLSALPKIAAFGLLINFLSPFTDPAIKWNAFDFQLFLSIVAIATMIAGNFAAALQNNVKRMLAYSSIGHTGFAMMALVNFSLAGQGIGALKFYLLAYAFAGTAAWMLATYFADTAGAEEMSGYKGLGFKYPLAGVCFIIILISLTGIPLTAGFDGKLLAFSAVYSVYRDSHNTWMLLLMITGAITTVVSLFYYIKIPLNLFLRKTDRTTGFAASNNVLLVCITIITILIVYLGVFPDFIYKYL